jgi:hypothetical protein
VLTPEVPTASPARAKRAEKGRADSTRNIKGARVEDSPNEAREKILSLLHVFAKGPEYSNTLEESVGFCCSEARLSAFGVATFERVLVCRWALNLGANRDRLERVAKERKVGAGVTPQVKLRIEAMASNLDADMVDEDRDLLRPPLNAFRHSAAAEPRDLPRYKTARLGSTRLPVDATMDSPIYYSKSEFIETVSNSLSAISNGLPSDSVGYWK